MLRFHKNMGFLPKELEKRNNRNNDAFSMHQHRRHLRLKCSHLLNVVQVDLVASDRERVELGTILEKIRWELKRVHREGEA